MKNKFKEFKGFSGLNPLEIDAFKKHLNTVSGVGVEIGCLDGFSAKHILECSGLHLTSIDPIIPDSQEASLIGSVENIQYNLEGLEDRFTFIQDYSYNISPNWEEELDFLFIDGDHGYEECLRDFKEWTPKLKKGAILGMHDSLMGHNGRANFHAGPTKVTNELVRGTPDEWEILEEAFSLTLARKK
jgi:predicted O-methyltransferase YrrM